MTQICTILDVKHDHRNFETKETPLHLYKTVFHSLRIIPFLFSDSFIQIMSVIIENLTEDNVTEFIIRYLGKPRINNETLYPLTFIYSSFLLLGLLGNLATCIVILNNEYMKSPTNVYLINLAVADIATLLLGNKLHHFAKTLFTNKILHRNTIFNTKYFNF